MKVSITASTLFLTLFWLPFVLSSCRLTNSPENDRLPQTKFYSNLWTINDDRTGLKQLTFNDQYCHFAQFTPDGKMILAVLSSSSTSDETLYSLDTSTYALTPIVSSNIIQRIGNGFSNDVTCRLIVTPDSKKIIFSKVVFTDDLAGDIYCVNIGGSGLTNLTQFDDSTRVHGISLSGDGKTILYDELTYTHQRNFLRTMDLQGGNKRTLKQFDTTSIYYPQFSPDGTKIVFFEKRNNSDQFTIKAVDVNDTSNVTVIGTTNLNMYPSAPPYFPKLSPQGSVIITEGTEIFSLSILSAVKQDLGLPAFLWLPYFSDDGTMIVYTDEIGNNLYTMGTDGSNKTNVFSIASSMINMIQFPRLTTNNHKIVFLRRQVLTN